MDDHQNIMNSHLLFIKINISLIIFKSSNLHFNLALTFIMIKYAIIAIILSHYFHHLKFVIKKNHL